MELKEWTDKDFDKITWDLSVLHSFSAPNEQFEFCLDIDFILEATLTNQDNRYELTVAPCLLCFENVNEVNMNLTLSIGQSVIEITREFPKKYKGIIFWEYCILLDTGKITFSSSGFRQKMLAPPKTSWGMEYNSRGLKDYKIIT